ncbi:hypothetical protein Cgig2_017446 [Carnegiea gigantea]|uniref:Gnk2-homologous domain-containing protein n=1 Tax=Carnegiea gigantea TaxID=171969 RepID=A0A9Q1Q4S6_9CARY|nr:hypothetical protein Cgig2_017446 [Carnegiea gigantea]
MALLHHVVVAYAFSFIVTYSLAYDAQGSYCDPNSGIPTTFYGKVDTSNGLLIGNQDSVTDIKSFSKDLGKFFDKINADTVKPTSGGFATGVKDVSVFDTIYGMAQCTKDLSSLSCAECLNTAIQNFQDFCSGRKGCRVLYSTCSVRYELYPYIFPVGSQKTPSEALTKLIVHH